MCRRDDYPPYEQEVESRCPACGEYISYCQGHGEIGDPAGYQILQDHDNDIHLSCHENSDCVQFCNHEWRRIEFDVDGGGIIHRCKKCDTIKEAKEIFSKEN